MNKPIASETLSAPAPESPEGGNSSTPVEATPEISPSDVGLKDGGPSADMTLPPEPSLPQARQKTKGVVDLVFLVDVSGSMTTCIDALRRNIEVFVDSLKQGDSNNGTPVRDWRGRVVGYRDIEAALSENQPWIIENPFVREFRSPESPTRWLAGFRRG